MIKQERALVERLGLQRLVISLRDPQGLYFLPDPESTYCKGTVTVVSANAWYPPNGKPYTVQLKDPTWADILRAADESLIVMDDWDHHFLESIDHRGCVIEFHFGS
jgi:hypothetical protein